MVGTGEDCALESRMCWWDKLEPLLRLLGSKQGFLAFIVRKSQRWHRGHPSLHFSVVAPSSGGECAQEPVKCRSFSKKCFTPDTRSSIFNLTLRDAL